MYKKWIDKIQYRYVSICILFFPGRLCHIATTERPVAKYLPVLIRLFRQKGFETIATEVVSANYSNHWGRTDDKYMWRYLMSAAGFHILNNDGTLFYEVVEKTRDSQKVEAMKHYEFLSLRPALSFIFTESRRRRRPFLPRQVVQKLLRDARQTLLYSYSESVILGLKVVPEWLFERVHFRKGRIVYESTICKDDFPSSSISWLRKCHSASRINQYLDIKK